MQIELNWSYCIASIYMYIYIFVIFEKKFERILLGTIAIYAHLNK